MKVLLALAPWSFAETYPCSMSRKKGFGKRFGLITGAPPHLGLLYLAASLKKAGHKVILMDGIHYTNEELIARVKEELPDVVGLSCTTFGWERSKKLVTHIKSTYNHIYTMVGGPFVSAWKDKCLEECPELDFAIIGEGEGTCVELLSNIEVRKPLDSIKGLVWRNGGITVNELRPPQDLDELPFPALDMIDLKDYSPSIGFFNALPSASMITSRGCPYNCSFCMARKSLELRSVENVLEEMSLVVNKYGARHILFWDEDFAVDYSRAMELCESIIKLGLKVSWCSNARVDSVDKRLLKTMKRAGCWKLLLGIESGVQKNLDRMNKGITLEQIRASLALTKECGIETFGTTMFGYPGETFEEGLKTIEFVCSCKLDYTSFLNFIPFPGTPIFEEVKKHGRLTNRWGPHQICFVPHSMTEDEMIELNIIAHNRFYFRPRYMFKRILAMRSLEDVRRNIRGVMAFGNLKPADFRT